MTSSPALKAPLENIPAASLVVYHTGVSTRWNEIGRSYDLADFGSEIFIGDHESADVQLPKEVRHPCNVRFYQNAQGQWHFENLEPANNTFVNEVISRARRLHDGDRIQIGSVTFRFLDGQGKESVFHHGLQRVIGTDVLTGISNRRQLSEELARAMAYCHRNQRSFCLVLIDFDDFSKINNTYGHVAGDVVLREMSARIRQNIRAEDIFGREGGEEFLLGLPNLTRDIAFSFVERVRKEVTKTPILFQDASIVATFSAGLTEVTQKTTLEELKQQADAQMYEAKRLGKNRVIMSGTP